MAKEQYIAKNMEIRRILHDIIDVAYMDQPAEVREKLKKFYLEFSKKKVKSYAGVYTFHNRTLKIVGLERPSKHIVITSLHELSHHIEYVLTGSSGHGETFYSIYKKLLFAALNMGIITSEDINEVKDVTDADKIKKMLNGYIPEKMAYKNKLFVFSCSNCYNVKEKLSSIGYSWDGLERVWKNEIPEEDIEEEKSLLDSWGVTYTISAANDINVKAIGTIIISGKTYDHRNYLGKEGFTYKKEKKFWIKACPYDQIELEIKRLQINGLIGLKIEWK